MNLRRLGPAAVLAAAALAATSSPALAVAAEPTAAFAGHLVGGPGATTVKISYTCTKDTPAAASHLFVAVKQGPNVNATDQSSSEFADTFYSTNWKSDRGPNRLRCDGVQHKQTIILKPQPGFHAAVRRLHRGPALVQICVYDNVTQFDPTTHEPTDGGFAASYTMQNVRAGKHRHH